MSDYLNNIVTRSLSVADVVQPRLPHLFEQPPAVTVSVPDDVVALEFAETSSEPSRPDEPSYTPPLRVTVNPQVAAPALRPDPELEVVAAPRAPVAHDQPARGVEVTNRIGRPVARDNAGPIVRSASPRMPTGEERRPTTQPTHSARVSEPSTASRVEHDRGHPSISVRRPGPLTSRSQLSVANAVLPTTPLNERADPPLPPIKINIGRVDVRAIMPAAPAPVSHAVRPKPALSLESYLKQREEGKR